MYSKVKPFLSFSDLNLYGFLIGWVTPPLYML
jgi:hypothetical protein